MPTKEAPSIAVAIISKAVFSGLHGNRSLQPGPLCATGDQDKGHDRDQYQRHVNAKDGKRKDLANNRPVNWVRHSYSHITG